MQLKSITSDSKFRPILKSGFVAAVSSGLAFTLVQQQLAHGHIPDAGLANPGFFPFTLPNVLMGGVIAVSSVLSVMSVAATALNVGVAVSERKRAKSTTPRELEF